MLSYFGLNNQIKISLDSNYGSAIELDQVPEKHLIGRKLHLSGSNDRLSYINSFCWIDDPLKIHISTGFIMCMGILVFTEDGKLGFRHSLPEERDFHALAKRLIIQGEKIEQLTFLGNDTIYPLHPQDRVWEKLNIFKGLDAIPGFIEDVKINYVDIHSLPANPRYDYFNRPEIDMMIGDGYVTAWMKRTYQCFFSSTLEDIKTPPLSEES